MDVYVLKDPTSGAVRYAGITRQPLKERLRQHIKAARTRERKNQYLSPKDRWVLFLLSIDKKPAIVSLARGLNESTAVREEKKIIEAFKRTYEGGTLLNVDDGGSYDICDGERAWNKGRKDWLSADLKVQMKSNQPERKEVFRFDKHGNFIDSWVSIRTMCDELGLERRTVMRCLKKDPTYNSHKGFMFSHSRNEVPVYHNRSTELSGEKSPHSHPIYGVKNDVRVEFGSITEATGFIGISYPTIKRALKTGCAVKGYYWYYQKEKDDGSA